MAIKWIHVGDILGMNATNYPDKTGWQDKRNEYTFKQWNERACRFGNGLKDLGIAAGDTFAVLSYNRGEWMDIYAGCAKGSQIVVPLLFRLTAPEIQYIVRHSDCKGFIVEAAFVDLINSIKDSLPAPQDRYIYLGDGPAPEGYTGFEDFLANASPEEPGNNTSCDDTWIACARTRVLDAALQSRLRPTLLFVIHFAAYAAVNHDVFAGDVGRFSRCRKQDHISLLVRTGYPVH
jgi:acyl-CoA synthetase (AMP-forming)/AMP-acid ligase II